MNIIIFIKFYLFGKYKIELQENHDINSKSNGDHNEKSSLHSKINFFINFVSYLFSMCIESFWNSTGTDYFEKLNNIVLQK